MTSTSMASPSQELVEWIRTDERRNQIALALPEGVSFSRFERATATALISKPELAKADRASLYLAVLNAAQAGLVPDGKQGAIVVYNTKVKDDHQGERWIEKAQFLPMIGGVRDTLAEFGWMLQTGVIYENDEFTYDEAEALVVHRPPRPGVDRGAIEGAYALARHKDGRRRQAVVMTKAEIDYVRDKSSRSKKVWEDWYTRMAEKTPGHRLAKKLPLDPKDKQRMDAILDADQMEHGEAAVMLYGPRAIIAHELPEGEPSVTPTDSGNQPAGEAVRPDVSSPAAEPEPADDEGAPGPEDAGEPEVVDEGGSQDDTEFRALADAAALYDPKSKQWPGMALGEILNHGDDGRKYVQWCLTNAKEPEFVSALFNLTRVYAPELYHEALAKKELGQ